MSVKQYKMSTLADKHSPKEEAAAEPKKGRSLKAKKK